jgi:hypothetical protein
MLIDYLGTETHLAGLSMAPQLAVKDAWERCVWGGRALHRWSKAVFSIAVDHVRVDIVRMAALFRQSTRQDDSSTWTRFDTGSNSTLPLH